MVSLLRLCLLFIGFHRFRQIGIIIRAVRAAAQVVMPAIHGDSATAARLKIMPVCAFNDIAAVITAGGIPYNLSHLSAPQCQNGSYIVEALHIACSFITPRNPFSAFFKGLSINS